MQLGWYSTLREASADLSTDDAIKAKPAHEVFAYILSKRMNNKVEYKTQVIMSEVAK